MNPDPKDSPDMLIRSAEDDAKDVYGALTILVKKIDASIEAVNEIFTPLWGCATGVTDEIWSLTRTPEDEEGEPPEDAAERREIRAAMTVEKAIAAHLESMHWVEARLKEVDEQVKIALGSLTDGYDLSENDEWPPSRA